MPYTAMLLELSSYPSSRWCSSFSQSLQCPWSSASSLSGIGAVSFSSAIFNQEVGSHRVPSNALNLPRCDWFRAQHVHFLLLLWGTDARWEVSHLCMCGPLKRCWRSVNSSDLVPTSKSGLQNERQSGRQLWSGCNRMQYCLALFQRLYTKTKAFVIYAGC